MRLYKSVTETGLGKPVDVGYVLTPRYISAKEDGELVWPGEWLPDSAGREAGCAENILCVEALVYDYDQASAPPPTLPYKSFVWTSFNHKGTKGAHAYRVFVPTDRPMAPLEWEILWHHVGRLLGRKKELEKCKNIDRLFYLPVRDCAALTGPTLCVDSVLAELGTGFILPPSISVGGRDSTLMRFAMSLASRGVPEGVILKAVEVVNASRCDPPVGAEEFARYVATGLDKSGAETTTVLDVVKGALKAVGMRAAEMAEVLASFAHTLRKPLADGSHVTFANAVVGETTIGMCARDGEVVVWDGTTWRERRSDDLRSEILKIDRFPYVTKRGKIDRIEITTGLIGSVVSVIRDMARRTPVEPLTVATPSGNLVNGAIVNPRPAYGARDALCFEPEQGYPTEWVDFLRSLWPTDWEDKVECLATFIGACITQRATALKRALVFIGRSNSGKSTLCEAIRGMLPQGRVSAIEPASWGDEKKRYGLLGKWLNVVEELPHSDILCSSAFKEVIAGGTVSVWKMYVGSESVRMCAGHIFATNNLPTVGDPSDGSWDRLIPITFKIKFGQNAGEAARISQALKVGRGRWLSYCLERAYANSLPEPACSRKVKQSWRKCEPVWAWSQENRGVRFREVDAAYDSFRAYCHQKGHRQLVGQPKFEERVRALGGKISKGSMSLPGTPKGQKAKCP